MIYNSDWLLGPNLSSKIPKKTSDGVWMMSIYGTGISPDGADIYKSDTGSITIKQHADGKDVTIYGPPRIYVKYNSLGHYYNLWYSSGKSGLDKSHTVFIIGRIEMNEELQEQALKTSAFKNIYKTNSTHYYSMFDVDENADINSISAWLTSILGTPLDKNSHNIKKIVSVAFSVLLIILTLYCCMNSGSGGTKSATCKSCGRTFQAGDSGGNYKNIARTGMCNNCYGNFQWGQKAIGND